MDLRYFTQTIDFLTKGYTLKKLPDGKVWVMENLREEIKGAVWNEQYNCYMYTWEQALKATPRGFRLPSRNEFVTLCKCLGCSQDDDKTVAKRLINECSFVCSGFVDATDGSLSHQSKYGSYWSSTWYSSTTAYGLWFSSNIISVDNIGSKDNRRAVRLIKD